MKMSFGHHQGKHLKEIPEDYLLAVRRRLQPWYEVVRSELERRGARLPTELPADAPICHVCGPLVRPSIRWGEDARGRMMAAPMRAMLPRTPEPAAL